MFCQRAEHASKLSSVTNDIVFDKKLVCTTLPANFTSQFSSIWYKIQSRHSIAANVNVKNIFTHRTKGALS